MTRRSDLSGGGERALFGNSSGGEKAAMRLGRSGGGELAAGRQQNPAMEKSAGAGDKAGSKTAGAERGARRLEQTTRETQSAGAEIKTPARRFQRRAELAAEKSPTRRQGEAGRASEGKDQTQQPEAKPAEKQPRANRLQQRQKNLAQRLDRIEQQGAALREQRDRTSNEQEKAEINKELGRLSNERKALLLKQKGFQDHHLVSDKNALTKEHELWSLAGRDRDSRWNKMFLPKKESVYEKRSLHSGRHRVSLAALNKEKMDAIVDKGKRENWTQKDYREALDRLIKEERELCRSGQRALNKNHREGAE